MLRQVPDSEDCKVAGDHPPMVLSTAITEPPNSGSELWNSEPRDAERNANINVFEIFRFVSIHHVHPAYGMMCTCGNALHPCTSECYSTRAGTTDDTWGEARITKLGFSGMTLKLLQTYNRSYVRTGRIKATTRNNYAQYPMTLKLKMQTARSLSLLNDKVRRRLMSACHQQASCRPQ
jgi:hypothetical protein